MSDIELLNKKTREFIEKNNIFIDEYDVEFVGNGYNRISTFGQSNVTTNHIKYKDKSSLKNPGQIVYKVKYEFDSHGRKTTSHTNHIKTKKSIFFGDSILFGEGLSSDETFPHYFEVFNTEYESYNYGFPGHGPGHMLLHLQSLEFKDEFRDSEGDVFFVYRDDSIKNTCGQVSWNEGFPKYKIENGKLVRNGFFRNEPGEDNYLPTQHTDEDYQLILEIFKKSKEEILKISSNLKFHVIFLPLSFTNFKTSELLKLHNINTYNLYHVDIENFLGKYSRFLDGMPTKHTNRFLNERLSFYIKNNIDFNSPIPTNNFYDISELNYRIKLHGFFMSSMSEFPIDDAGVLVSMVLSQYKGSDNYDFNDLIILCEKYFNKKKYAIKLLNENREQELHELLDEFDTSIHQLFKMEYVDSIKIHNKDAYKIFG